MLKKIALFLRIKRDRKVLLIFGFFLSIYAYFLFKYNKKKARFGRKNKSVYPTSSVAIAAIYDIRFVIRVLTKYIPWEFMCRHQAWVVGYLLFKHEIPFTVFVGFKKNPKGVIEGHAWTIAQDVMVTGFCNPSEYTIQATYSG